MPLLDELSRPSWDLFESDSDSNESRDVRLNSPKSGVFDFSCFFHEIFDSIDSISGNITKIQKNKMPLFGELSQTSQDSFESESDSNKSRDDRLTSPKSCIFLNMPLLGELSRSSQDSFESDSDSKESWDDRLNTIFWRVKPNVPGFFRLKTQFERIPGRSA